jgi:hypothetical protein
MIDPAFVGFVAQENARVVLERLLLQDLSQTLISILHPFTSLRSEQTPQSSIKCVLEEVCYPVASFEKFRRVLSAGRLSKH